MTTLTKSNDVLTLAVGPPGMIKILGGVHLFPTSALRFPVDSVVWYSCNQWNRFGVGLKEGSKVTVEELSGEDCGALFRQLDKYMKT